MQHRIVVAPWALTGLSQVIIDQVFPAIQEAVQQASIKTQVAWQAAVMQAPGVWLDGKKRYADSIQWQMVGPTASEVWTEEEIASQVETGFPAFDQKQWLQTSKRTRLNKKGEKYLIIPFRHNTTGNGALARPMPADIYAQAKALPASSVTGKTTRLSATGATVPQNIYQWGGKLAAGLAPKLKPHHATDIYAGMVRFNTSSGGQKSSAYLTFRVMKANQTGKWILPAKPGLFLVQNMMSGLQAMVEGEIGSAVEAALAG